MHIKTTRRSQLGIVLPGVALVVSCWLGAAAAQGLSLRAADWNIAELTSRSGEAPAATTFDIGADRSSGFESVALSPMLEARTTREVVLVGYRAWLSRGRADFGVGFGSMGMVVPPVAGFSVTSVAGVQPVVVLGVRYRLSNQHLLFADAFRSRRLGSDPAADHVATKVGLEWRPATQTLGFEHGAFGMRLDSGYRLSLKVRGGGLALYLRGRF